MLRSCKCSFTSLFTYTCLLQLLGNIFQQLGGQGQMGGFMVGEGGNATGGVKLATAQHFGLKRLMGVC